MCIKRKASQLGPLKGTMKLEWVGDGKITPEELFEDDEDFAKDSEDVKQG